MTNITTPVFILFFLLPAAQKANSQSGAIKNTPEFKKTIITTDFISEGVAAGDINKDGKTDIIAGYYWFESPRWKRHEIAPSRVFDPNKEYSNSFLNECFDVNLDGWSDVIIIDYPGKVAHWFENPAGKPGSWKQHLIGDSIGIANESPRFVDVDGDGRLDLLCGDVKTQQIIWLQAPTKKGQTEWKRYTITKEKFPGTDRFSHGLGYGDINKDGKKDVILTAGWIEGPVHTKQANPVFHPGNLGEPCSQMYSIDVNADGRNDVVSASAHKLGIWWYEQVVDRSGKIDWRRNLISEVVSQTHASVLIDINGDGRPDFITGKRYLAHHDSSDPGTNDPSLLIWLELISGAPYWKLHEIDNNSGVGLNIVAKDINKDGRTDIVIANKKGVFLFENLIRPKKKSKK